jgi:hypothetical protein
MPINSYTAICAARTEYSTVRDDIVRSFHELADEGEVVQIEVQVAAKFPQNLGAITVGYGLRHEISEPIRE